MPSTRTLFTALVALGTSVTSTYAQAIQIDGCYSDPGALRYGGINPYQSQGACLKQCFADDKAVFGLTKGSTCFCGDEIPDASKKVDVNNCNVSCNGYGESCGGQLAFLIGYTGALPPSIPHSSTSGSSKPTSSATRPAQTTIIKDGQVTVTAAPEGSDTAGAKKGGASKAGIAAGAVVGVVAVIGIGLGAFLVARRNRRLRAEEEYRAAVAAKEFTATIRKPQSDARLDPVMLQHRRMSDGSIADNQDYSRRILKVINPDGA